MTTGDSRWDQIIHCTIDQIAENGYAEASLAKIAVRAGISKPAILHHFSNKSELMAATMEWLYTDLTAYVNGHIVRSAPGTPAIEAYIRSMMEYMLANPSHVRLLIEVMTSGELAASPQNGEPAHRRWQDVATLLADGQRSGELGEFDPKFVAITIGGAIDALVTEWVADPTFDLPEATDSLVGLVGHITRRDL